MGSTTAFTSINSLKLLGQKAERKRAAYRQWLLAQINGPTPGLPDNLVAALTQPMSSRVAEHWLRASNIDRDGPRNEGELPIRQVLPRQLLPPTC